MRRGKYRKRAHGSDEAALGRCGCAACSQRRTELAVLAELSQFVTHIDPQPIVETQEMTA